jgi:hypothetical protein
MHHVNPRSNIFSLSLLFAVVLVHGEATGQNLVLNPSFEIQDCCPFDSGPSNCATYWTTNMNSWDYFHECNGTVVSVPNNFAGHQWAATGDAYVGFIAWGASPSDPPPYFPIEIVGGTLSEPLEVGTTYHVSFKVSLASAVLQCCYSDKLGILFINRSYGYLGYSQVGRPPIVQDFAHVHEEDAVLESVNWTSIEGSFTADSAYTHFLIGRFFTDEPDTDPCWCTMPHVNNHAYYYLDDVCVSSERNVCREGGGGSDDLPFTWIVTPDAIVITPASAGVQLNVDLFDASGRQIISRSNGAEVVLDISNLAMGIYSLRIQSDDSASTSVQVMAAR